ncbi:hypothetical protein A2Z33_01885 [Candidatus Gottesmanbacteria bacterium RBG_16_52_11]|uniref:Uncharacterized protein n=1 Tax=Candidatus Gottesmanbacteria bacterium RBG_16_52_11 TaxID=1798374 RepID=A0A1F5YRC2_9BACT|nr:MAG: hypothetical protein A2Z33_01885 [Candidatus Gottesmanbacteria bacterium RBG_16_52_11]
MPRDRGGFIASYAQQFASAERSKAFNEVRPAYEAAARITVHIREFATGMTSGGWTEDQARTQLAKIFGLVGYNATDFRIETLEIPELRGADGTEILYALEQFAASLPSDQLKQVFGWLTEGTSARSAFSTAFLQGVATQKGGPLDDRMKQEAYLEALTNVTADIHMFQDIVNAGVSFLTPDES